MTDLDAFYRRYLACCNERRFDDLGQFVNDPIRFNGEDTPLADYAAAIAGNIAATPDYRWAVEELVASDDAIAVRLTDTGTPRRTWLGIAPTGLSMRITEFAIYRVRDGRIAEMSFLLDEPAARRQLQSNEQAYSVVGKYDDRR